MPSRLLPLTSLLPAAAKTRKGLIQNMQMDMSPQFHYSVPVCRNGASRRMQKPLYRYPRCASTWFRNATQITKISGLQSWLPGCPSQCLWHRLAVRPHRPQTMTRPTMRRMMTFCSILEWPAGKLHCHPACLEPYQFARTIPYSNDLTHQVARCSRSQLSGETSISDHNATARPAEDTAAESSRRQKVGATPWFRLQRALLDRWHTAGLEAALSRVQLPEGWGVQLPEGWRPLSSVQSWWTRCSDSMGAQMQSVDAQLQQTLRQMPLPQLSCSRRSALRLRVHHCEWQALRALLAPRQPDALELVLETETPHLTADASL